MPEGSRKSLWADGRPNPNQLQYTVMCGYEAHDQQVVNYLNGEEPYRHGLVVIANSLDFVDAAHIVRTLEEKGEGDMTYFMMPMAAWEYGRTKWETSDQRPDLMKCLTCGAAIPAVLDDCPACNPPVKALTHDGEEYADH